MIFKIGIFLLIIGVIKLCIALYMKVRESKK